MGAYRILRRLSSAGGFVETFSGRQESSDRPVLLKRLTRPVANLDRLLEVARLMRGPGLPLLLEAGSTSEGVLVTEAAEGVAAG